MPTAVLQCFVLCVENVGLETQLSQSPDNSSPEQQRVMMDDTTGHFLDAPADCTLTKDRSSPSSVSSMLTSPPSSPKPLHKQSITTDMSSCEELNVEATTPTGRHYIYDKQCSYFSLVGTVDCLVLIVHGGTVLKSTISKEYDKATVTDTITRLTKSHFQGQGKVAVRMVSCQSLTTEITEIMKELKPPDVEPLSPGANSDTDPARLSSLPITLMAVLSTESKSYNSVLNDVIAAANLEYTSFLQTEEGQGFTGQVTQ